MSTHTGMRRRWILLLAAAVLIAGCAATPGKFAMQHVDPAPTEPRLAYLSNLYFAGQPDRDDLAQAKRDGVTVVINLRAPSEIDWDEAQVADQLGLIYYNVPITAGDGFQAEAIDHIDRLTARHADEEILVHCASGNRAGAWLAVHLVEQDGLSVDEALAIGKSVGITSSAIEKRVRDHLEPSTR